MATNLQRTLNPDTGEWEVNQNQTPTTQPPNYQPSKPTTFGAGSTSAPASGGAAPLPPPPPVVYNAPQVAGSNMYNPNGDFVQGGVNPATYADNVAASGTQTATPTTTAPTTTTTGNSTLDWVNSMAKKYSLGTHDPSYWVNAIDSNGGFSGRHDQAYWENRIAQGENYVGAGPSQTSFAMPTTLLSQPSYSSPSYSAPAAASSFDPLSVDPFASMGGGVRLAGGGWVPKGHPDANGPLWQEPAPIAPTPAAPTPTAPVAAVAPTTGTSPVAPQVPITTSNPTAAETAALVNRPENVDIQMLLNAGSTNPDAPSTTNPKTFNPASEEVLRASPEDAAFRLGAQRSEERQRAQLAERASANGMSQSGGFENQLAGLRQSRGEQESQFLGQLAITKMQQAREDLVNGIQFALSNQQFDKAQGLQKELALLNASLQEKQLAAQVSTADKDRAMQEILADKNISMQEKLAAIQAATTERGQSLNASTAGNALTENARQYDLGLGFNYTSLQQQANQQAALAALQGWG